MQNLKLTRFEKKSIDELFDYWKNSSARRPELIKAFDLLQELVSRIEIQTTPCNRCIHSACVGEKNFACLLSNNAIIPPGVVFVGCKKFEDDDIPF